MNRWIHWVVTCLIAAVAGCVGALAVVELGGADGQIHQVTQPAIDSSADSQRQALDVAVQDEEQKILSAVGTVSRSLADRLTELEGREYRIGVGYECRVGLHDVTVVVVDYGGSTAERICIVQD